MSNNYQIIDHEIDVLSLVKKVSKPEAGATTTFIGTSRNFTGNQAVSYLFYEAYESMALKLIEKIGNDAISKFKITDIAITHRIGKVDIEEASVVIAVSASHREPAFEACQYAINTLKRIVPIWKKEFMENGKEMWIGNRE